MTVQELRRALEAMDASLDIVIMAPILDRDGDDVETWFDLKRVSTEMNPDTGEDYVRLACDQNFDQ